VVAFSHKDKSGATTRNLMLVYVGWSALRWTEWGLFRFFAPDFPRGVNFWTAAVIGWSAALVLLVWMAGASRKAVQGATEVRRPTLRGVGFAVAMSLAAYATPSWPTFFSQRFQLESVNLWESYRAYASRQTPEQTATARNSARQAEARAARLEAKQGVLLDAAIARLAPRDPSKPNVFAVGVAGWSDQAVFMRETRRSLEILVERFGLGDRSLALINNQATADDTPMASMQNLSAALRAVAARMDRDKDVLLLTLTSHGSPDGFALRYDDLFDRALDPETLRSLLDEAGVKNRVIIVSSCYSGTFVAPLSGPNTMILTAASSVRTSFGCADDRNWTYFGEALFEKALAQPATLADAFLAAKATIAQWEQEQKLTPSEPQIFVGEAIARDFPELVGKPAGPAPTRASLEQAPPSSL
jgi:hypothetical protein